MDVNRGHVFWSRRMVDAPEAPRERGVVPEHLQYVPTNLIHLTLRINNCDPPTNNTANIFIVSSVSQVYGKYCAPYLYLYHISMSICRSSSFYQADASEVGGD